VICSGNVRECRISGNQAVTWSITPHVATKADFVKKKSRKDLELELAKAHKLNAELLAIAEDAVQALLEVEGKL